jgi:hypothetical protein
LKIISAISDIRHSGVNDIGEKFCLRKSLIPILAEAQYQYLSLFRYRTNAISDNLISDIKRFISSIFIFMFMFMFRFMIRFMFMVIDIEMKTDTALDFECWISVKFVSDIQPTVMLYSALFHQIS